MTRRFSTPPELPQVGNSIIADLVLRVVTPMFGGGVDPGVNDLDDLIRAPAIRGQLRFWWRACNAGRFENLKQMHDEESRLWGSMRRSNDRKSGHGAIGVWVLPVENGGGTNFILEEDYRIRGHGAAYEAVYGDDGEPLADEYWRRNGTREFNRSELGPNFVLFPFDRQPKAKPPQPEPRVGKVDLEFRLQLHLAPNVSAGSWNKDTEGRDALDQCMRAAEQALWSWITFGGVGARTRRGCGTLWCTPDSSVESKPWLQATAFSPLPSSNQRERVRVEEVHEWLERRFADLVDSSRTTDSLRISSLAASRIRIKPASSIFSAWNQAARSLSDFLQGGDNGRNRGSRKPGQSRWTEVSAVRRILGFPNPPFDSDGHPYVVLPEDQPLKTQFPRAELGLPKTIRTKTHNDAPSATMEADGKDATRMASPVILKALPIDSGTAVSLALCFRAPLLSETRTPRLRISYRKDEKDCVELIDITPLNDGEYPAWWPQKRRPRRVEDEGVSSARDAFMMTLGPESGWRLVK